MKQLFLDAASLAAMNLKADVDQSAVNTAIAELAAKASKVPVLESQLAAANLEKQKAIDDLKAEKENVDKKAVEELLDKALSVDKKVTKELRATLATQFAGKPTELKNLLDVMQPITSVVDKIKEGAVSDEEAKMSWAELDQKGRLENLKAKNPELFKAKYKEAFEEDYKG